MAATATDSRVSATGLDYHALNAMLNLYDADGKIQFDKDREAAREYFLQHVNQNTVFFHDLDEKLDYLVENKYYDPAVLAKYDRAFLKTLFEYAYSKKFRFSTFLGAFFRASANVMSGMTTPRERVLMRTFSSAFSRLVSRNR